VDRGFIIVVVVIIRLHRSPPTLMRPIVTDGVVWSVTIVNPAKMAELIEMSFGTWIQVSPWKHALDGDVHWWNVANTIEPSICCSDAAFMSNYFTYIHTYIHTY